jgi:signal transduction histidine kinase
VARVEEDKLLHGFVGAFVAVALAFIAASVGTFVALRDITAATHDLLGNALPSVSELMRARTAQRKLDVDVGVMTKTGAARVELIDELDAARAELDSTLNAAMSTPDYPGEREIYLREAQPRMAQLDRAIDELRAAVNAEPRDEGRILAALPPLNAAAKELDSSLQSLAELNHAKAFEAAWRITSTHAHAVRVAMYLEGASAVAAMVAATIAVRAGRRFGAKARRQFEFERDRASELDALAQRVAHDLMSPLAAASLSLQAVRRAHPDADTVRATERGLRALERSRKMVEGIYAFSRSGARPVAGAAAPLRATVVQSADELLASEERPCPTIDVQISDEVQVVMDRAILGVVVSNLLSNALKFSRDSAVRKVTARADADERHVHVEIEDTGPGVPPGLEETIFEPYQRAPGVTQPGLGLGLATVQRLVLTHGGAIGVRAARSGGAIFWFDLPRVPATHREEQAAEQRSHPGGAAVSTS